MVGCIFFVGLNYDVLFPRHCVASLSSTSSFTHSATSLSFAYVSNLAPGAAAPNPLLRGLHAAVAPQLHTPEQVLPDPVRLSCCSQIASTSAAAPRSSPPQLLLPDPVGLSCCSPIPSASSCCSLIASASAVAPWSCPPLLLLPDYIPYSCCSEVTVYTLSGLPRLSVPLLYLSHYYPAQQG